MQAQADREMVTVDSGLQIAKQAKVLVKAVAHAFYDDLYDVLAALSANHIVLPSYYYPSPLLFYAEGEGNPLLSGGPVAYSATDTQPLNFIEVLAVAPIYLGTGFDCGILIRAF